MPGKLLRGGVALLTLTGVYLAAFADPTIFYMTSALVHLAVGAALMIFALAYLRQYPVATMFFLLCGVAGLYLATAGNTRPHLWILWMHIALGAAFLILCLRLAKHREYGVAAAVLILLPVSTQIHRRFFPNPANEIHNPSLVPVTMQEEGGGSATPFFPSPALTNTGATVPSNFFMDSEACGECHRDIYTQWKSSAHHFASFNNQFYAKSIEYMQDVTGVKPSKWCAGCHDHAMIFSGRFERPAKEQLTTAEAHAGLACTSCHSIVKIGGTTGNGDFTIEYPPLHNLAASSNPYMRKLAYFLTYLNPKPHRKTFLKPFMREESAKFCSTCHKVHLDIPVNNYRWIRGFNDYDNWQASGVSGQGARSFYYPEKSMTCADCHMPLTPSNDPGNVNGKIHSHRFPGANTAVPFVNHDQAQLKAVEDFLKSGFITLDIFAISPETSSEGTAMRRRTDTVRANSTFAVGEEAEPGVEATLREPGRIAAPIDAANAAIAPGSTARVDVVVRTRKIGHFFPGGTVDAFDVWLELQAKDADGKLVFWSGNVTGDGKGPVESGAHFYRAYLLDSEGSPINKRNAWQARSVLYVRLIPPGAADVAHFQVAVPAAARGPITFTAKLNYRKFSHFYTDFAFTGKPTPELPIITLAKAVVPVRLGKPDWIPVVRKQDRERWNDWGIGLLLQGDIKGAEYAFRKVTEADPAYADGWLNVARALIQEGQTDAAKSYLDRALSLNQSLARIWFFKAAVQKADGDFDGALQSLRLVSEKYPNDRVVGNQIARLLFLKRQYREAIDVLRQVSSIDPEDVQMHYTLMLCYRGLGDAEKAAREEKLFRRFKADEASQSITGIRRAIDPEDNNERQPIHEHESALR